MQLFAYPYIYEFKVYNRLVGFCAEAEVGGFPIPPADEVCCSQGLSCKSYVPY